MKQKICSKCRITKQLKEFYRDKGRKDLRNSYCKICSSEYNKKHDQSYNGLINRIYLSQVCHSKRRGHPTPDYTKDELRAWIHSKANNYEQLYYAWVKSGYETYLKPSCDRLFNDKPYTFSNLQLVTWGKNKENGYRDKSKAVIQSDLNGNFINQYISIRNAAMKTGTNKGSLYSTCAGGRKTANGFQWAFA